SSGRGLRGGNDVPELRRVLAVVASHTHDLSRPRDGHPGSDARSSYMTRHDATPQVITPVDPRRFRFIFPPVMKASDIRRGHVILIDRQLGIELPSVIELTVMETSPVMRGATKTASTKSAKLSNGVTIQVPEFITEGERVRVDPREGVYLERAK